MKRTIRTILYAAAVVLAAVSCQKSAEPVQPAEEGKETIDICVNGLMGEYTQVDQSKAQLVNNVRVSWEGDETVYVFDGVKCLGSLAAALEGTEDRYAILSTDDTHTVSTPASGTTTLTLVYSPLLTKTPTVNAGEISVSLASQNGEKAPFVAYATLDYTGTTITDAVVPFQFATSVIKVNCTGLKASTAITSATLSNVNTECKLTLSGDKAPVVAGGTNGTITRTGDAYFAADKVNEEGEAVFQIAVPVLETATGERVLTIEQGSDKVKDKKFTTKALSAATSVNTVCQLVGLPAGALKGEFSVSATKKVYFSKGNLWADSNKALHFEANQYSSASSWDASHVSHFTWSSTVEAAVGNSNSGDNIFCNESHKVSVDGGEAIYYALSKDEWKYLFNSRTMTNSKARYSNAVSGVTIGGSTYKGVFLYPDNYNGDVVSSSMTWDAINAAGIVFLPAAGARDGSSVGSVGDYGLYWSSSAYVEYYAYDVNFRSDNVNPGYYGGRRYGYSVRLITECQ